MSEETQATIVEEVPQDLIELQKTLGQLNGYQFALDNGSFPGKMAKEIVDLKKFLKDTYDQVYQQFINHPYYIKHASNSEESN